MRPRIFQALFTIACLFFLPIDLYAGIEDRKQVEIDAYIKTFSLPFRMKQHTAAESLAYTGHSDPRIFDLVEQQLLNNYC